MKSIYVIENEYGNVKIGMSKRPTDRIKSLSKQGGFVVKRIYVTAKCSNASYIENTIHRDLIKMRKIGEWFEIGFAEAVDIVNKKFELEAKYQHRNKDYNTMADNFWNKVSQLK